MGKSRPPHTNKGSYNLDSKGPQTGQHARPPGEMIHVKLILPGPLPYSPSPSSLFSLMASSSLPPREVPSSLLASVLFPLCSLSLGDSSCTFKKSDRGFRDAEGVRCKHGATGLVHLLTIRWAALAPLYPQECKNEGRAFLAGFTNRRPLRQSPRVTSQGAAGPVAKPAQCC